MKKILSVWALFVIVLVTVVSMVVMCSSKAQGPVYKIAELTIYKTPEGIKVMHADFRGDQYPDLCAFLEDVKKQCEIKCKTTKPQIPNGKDVPVKKVSRSTFLYLPKIPQARE